VRSLWLLSLDWLLLFVSALVLLLSDATHEASSACGRLGSEKTVRSSHACSSTRCRPQRPRHPRDRALVFEAPQRHARTARSPVVQVQSSISCCVRCADAIKIVLLTNDTDNRLKAEVREHILSCSACSQYSPRISPA
jgi:hypothetical protein